MRSPGSSGGRSRAGEALEGLSEEGFAEYFEPLASEPLGSDAQSWTAAVTLDWLAQDS